MNNKRTSIEKKIFDSLKNSILDPLALDLAKKVCWLELNGISKDNIDLYPVAITGEGPPLLLLHGFDSSFLEFRRIAPLLSKKYKLIIPDLFGFGFCPRPIAAKYDKNTIINHINSILENFESLGDFGVIGASMGGSLAIEIARLHPTKINRLLLLAPAGLTGKPAPVPPVLDKFGVWFLSLPKVRKSLCKQAFSDPLESVGKAEEQIASLHLNIPGWNRSLAAFARSGGFANCGTPLPKQSLHSIWGRDDRILKGINKKTSFDLLFPFTEEIAKCGHLPHLDQPIHVAKRWIEGFPVK